MKSEEGWTGWETERGNDFRSIAAVMSMAIKYPKIADISSGPQLQAFLKRSQSIPPKFEHDIRATFRVLALLARHTIYDKPLDKPQKTEFQMMAMLVYVYYGRLSLCQLSSAINGMRNSVNALRLPKTYAKRAIAYIRDLVNHFKELSSDGCGDIPALQELPQSATNADSLPIASSTGSRVVRKRRRSDEDQADDGDRKRATRSMNPRSTMADSRLPSSKKATSTDDRPVARTTRSARSATATNKSTRPQYTAEKVSTTSRRSGQLANGAATSRLDSSAKQRLSLKEAGIIPSEATDPIFGCEDPTKLLEEALGGGEAPSKPPVEEVIKRLHFSKKSQSRKAGTLTPLTVRVGSDWLTNAAPPPQAQVPSVTLQASSSVPIQNPGLRRAPMSEPPVAVLGYNGGTRITQGSHSAPPPEDTKPTVIGMVTDPSVLDSKHPAMFSLLQQSRLTSHNSAPHKRWLPLPAALTQTTHVTNAPKIGRAQPADEGYSPALLGVVTVASQPPLLRRDFNSRQRIPSMQQEMPSDTTRSPQVIVIAGRSSRATHPVMVRRAAHHS
jgi:hypothetical protein